MADADHPRPSTPLTCAARVRAMPHVPSLTRRRLLQTGAAGAALALAEGPTSALAAGRRRIKRADVVVVGAGFSGLAAARALVAGRALGDRARRARPRRRPHAERLDRRRQVHRRGRRAVRRPDPGPDPGAGPGGRRQDVRRLQQGQSVYLARRPADAVPRVRRDPRRPRGRGAAGRAARDRQAGGAGRGRRAVEAPEGAPTMA